MERSLTHRVLFIVGMLSVILLGEYLFGNEITVGIVVKYFGLVSMIEFSNYCVYVYRKDHDDL